MVTFVTQHYHGDGTVVIGVSSDWRTAVKRLMELFPDRTEYDQLNQLDTYLWEIRMDGEVVGLISKFVLNKRIPEFQ